LTTAFPLLQWALIMYDGVSNTDGIIFFKPLTYKV